MVNDSRGPVRLDSIDPRFDDSGLVANAGLLRGPIENRLSQTPIVIILSTGNHPPCLLLATRAGSKRKPEVSP